MGRAEEVLNDVWDSTNHQLRATTAALSSSVDSVTNVQKALTSDTLSSVASSATSVTLLAANASRRAATIFNDSTQILYVKFGATASTSSFKVQINPGGYYEFPLPIYTGIVDGIWAAANGNARVYEGV